MDSCRSNPSSGEIIPPETNLWQVIYTFLDHHQPSMVNSACVCTCPSPFFGGNQTTMFLDLSYNIGRQFKDVHELNSTILLKRFPILKPLKWIPWNETTSSFRFVAGLIGRVYVHGWLDHGKPPPGAQIHRKICGVSRWFGGWFKVPHTCLSDSVFCVFFMGFLGSSHIMTQLLPTIFEKYLVPFGCNEGFMPVGKQSWTWRWIVGSWGDPRNWPFKVKPFAACFCFFFRLRWAEKDVSVIHL